MSTGCSEFTPLKWERQRYLLDVHARMVRGIFKRHDWVYPVYHWIEPHCGPGIYDETDSLMLAGTKGSPVIAAEILIRELGGDHCKLILNDINPAVSDRCRKALRDLCLAEVSSMDCSEFVDHVIAELPRQLLKYYGMTFFDPNGPPRWEVLERFANESRFIHIDILVNLNSTAQKRCFMSPHPGHVKWDKRPTENVRQLNRKCFLIWAPAPSDRNQFALVVATNYEKFPGFRKHGFHPLNSDAGREIAERIDYTNEERRDRREREQRKIDFPSWEQS